jgi:hypothetical protein
MYVPPLLERYALSICSAHFTDWIQKRVTIEDRHGGSYGNQVDLYDFNLGETFNYAEMAWLMAPRPFMVERGHEDDVTAPEWVDSEYSKIRRFYDRLGIGNRTVIEHFNLDFHFCDLVDNLLTSSDAFIHAGSKLMKMLRRSTPNG